MIKATKAFFTRHYFQWKYRNVRCFNPLSKGSLRNLPCPCGKKKKTKHCHGSQDSVSAKEIIEIRRIMANYAIQHKDAMIKLLKAKADLEASNGN